MKKEISDSAINELYQQRKAETITPQVNLAHQLVNPRKIGSFSQKVLVIFGFTCFASFSLLAIMNYLNPPNTVKAKNTSNYSPRHRFTTRHTQPKRRD